VSFLIGAGEALENCQVIAYRRINVLIKTTQRSPFEGVGKPEPLKHNLSGFWSRRINEEHRLVYTIDADAVQIVQCRYHY
jgi:toxin YoeB